MSEIENPGGKYGINSTPYAFAEDETEMLYVAIENKYQHYLLKIPYSKLGI
ncbi:MAG: hypothetical protein PHP79_03495 [Clostridia bacterium]|nr:hypothetical protein [Clostridia bacterium]MDD4679943.1 hypothetical protein [Clostridia bacterium]